jgi:hypothetical protein
MVSSAISQAEKVILSSKEYKNLPYDFASLEAYIKENTSDSNSILAHEAYDEIKVYVLNLIGMYNGFSIKNILPDSSDKVCNIDDSDEQSKGTSISGWIRLSGKNKQHLCPDIRTNGLVWCFDKKATSSSFSAKGTGCAVIEGSNIIRANLSIRIAIRQAEEGKFYLFTSYPKDRIVIRFMLEKTKVFMPNGRGTIFRFYEKVINFFDGLIFENTDRSHPLCFLLHEEYGLTYISGIGNVKNANGDILFSSSSF